MGLNLLVAVGLTSSGLAAGSFLRPHDVIALVGGEDMVTASEYGYIEVLLTRALPGYQLRFRNLAWEGDTVFEQRRELNFPTWEEQLDKIGATVVIAQFGQMESLAGKEKLPEFLAAYEKLIERFSGGGKRRIMVIGPTAFHLDQKPREPAPENRSSALHDYIREIGGLCFTRFKEDRFVRSDLPDFHPFGRLLHDGMHLSQLGQNQMAWRLAGYLDLSPVNSEYGLFPETLAFTSSELESHRQLVVAKNRLWFNYWRPQNWAFLAGDRTSQPSSRDHLDPSKRWFPPEREAFLPLIEAKEKEIDTLTAKTAEK